MKMNFLFLTVFFSLQSLMQVYAQSKFINYIDSLQNIADGKMFEKPKEAIKINDKIISLCKKENYTDGSMRALYSNARRFELESNCSKCMYYALELEEEALNAGNFYYLGESKAFKIICYDTLGFLDERDATMEEFRILIGKIPESDYKYIESIRYFFIRSEINFDLGYPLKDSVAPYSLKMILAASKIRDKKEQEKRMAFAYLNRGCDFTKGSDSSIYYFKEGIRLKDPKCPDLTLATLHSNLSSEYFKNKLYKDALHEAEIALKISKKLGFSGLRIYKNIADIHAEMGDFKKSKIYSDRFKVVTDSIRKENKNDVHDISNIIKHIESEKQLKEEKKIYFALGLIFSILVCSLFYLRYIKLEKLKEQLVATIDSKNTESVSLEAKMDASLEVVISLARKDDPLFLICFKNSFPDFCKRLFEIQPELLSSEIKLCAFLKLNFSTKEIAQFTFVQPKAIQNRKNRIRKRLDIPPEIDIYVWIQSL